MPDALPPPPPAYTVSVAQPPEPFPAEYLPPHAEEVGTTADQFRALGSIGGVVGKAPAAAAQGTLELMTFPWLGVRGSTLVTIPFRAEEPQLVSFRVGPSLHFLPYHRVDVGVFFDGGVALVDIGKSVRTVMPAIAQGATFDVALSSFAVVHVEALLHSGIADRDDKAVFYLDGVGLLGLGLTL